MLTAGQDLRRLTSLRAVAALAVFAYHVGSTTNWIWHDRYLRLGYTGVAFFFVLSGFVLTWAWRPGDRAPLFYARRLARIYPAHIVTAAVALALPFYDSTFASWDTLANLTLTQAWFPPETAYSLNGVSWSLSCEAFFYLGTPFVVTALYRRQPSFTVAACGGWFAVTVVARLAASIDTGSTVQNMIYTNPLLRSGDFALGIMLALLVRSGWSPRIPLWVPAGLLVVVGAAFTVPHFGALGALPEVVLVPIFALTVLAAATADLRETKGLLQHRWATYAGEVSFAFYLVHEMVLKGAIEVLGAFPTKPTGLIFTIGTLATACVAAAMLHHLVEKPAQRRIVVASKTRMPVPSLG